MNKILCKKKIDFSTGKHESMQNLLKNTKKRKNIPNCMLANIICCNLKITESFAWSFT